MSDLNENARLWASDGFKDDSWINADALGDSANACVILPLAAFLELDAASVRDHAGCIGVRLEPGEQLDSIAERLGDIALIALVFPAFSDGRSFSKASLLRDRHGFTGPIRAVGDVLIDQIPLMLRSGFSEFEVSHETTIQRLEQGRVGGIELHYQPASSQSAKTESYSWRRSSAA